MRGSRRRGAELARGGVGFVGRGFRRRSQRKWLGRVSGLRSGRDRALEGSGLGVTRCAVGFLGVDPWESVGAGQ